MSRSRLYVQKGIMQSKYSVLYMATLTYDNEHLPEILVDNPFEEDKIPNLPKECYSVERAKSKKTGIERVAVFRYSDIQRLMKNLRNYFGTKNGRPTNEYMTLLKDIGTIRCDKGYRFKYLVAGERGGAKKRPHYHILFFVEPTPKMREYQQQGALGKAGLRAECLKMENHLRDLVRKYWSINKGTKKNPIWEPLFTYAEKWINGKKYSNFDLHYVDPYSSEKNHNSVFYYVTKYLIKGIASDHVYYKRLWALNVDKHLRNLAKTFIRCSRGLGSPVPLRSNGVDDWCCEYCEEIFTTIVRNAIRGSLDKGFSFVEPLTGKVSPLSRYYARRLPLAYFRQRYDYLEAHPELKYDEFADLTNRHYHEVMDRELNKVDPERSLLDSVLDSDELFVTGHVGQDSELDLSPEALHPAHDVTYTDRGKPIIPRKAYGTVNVHPDEYPIDPYTGRFVIPIAEPLSSADKFDAEHFYDEEVEGDMPAAVFNPPHDFSYFEDAKPTSDRLSRYYDDTARYYADCLRAETPEALSAVKPIDMTEFPEFEMTNPLTRKALSQFYGEFADFAVDEFTTGIQDTFEQYRTVPRHKAIKPKKCEK